MAKRDKQLLAFGLIALGAFLLFRKQAAATAPPSSTTTPPLVETESPITSRRVAGYFPSQLPAARPEMPFGVRWGTGEHFRDTTRHANMVL